MVHVEKVSIGDVLVGLLFRLDFVVRFRSSDGSRAGGCFPDEVLDDLRRFVWAQSVVEYERRDFLVGVLGSVYFLSHERVSMKYSVQDISSAIIADLFREFHCFQIPVVDISEDAGSGTNELFFAHEVVSGRTLSVQYDSMALRLVLDQLVE